MAKNYSIGSTLRNEFLPNTNPQTTSKTGMVFGWRTLGADNKIIKSLGSEPQPGLYVPFYLGSYQDGFSALDKLKQMGFQYTLGLNFDTTFIKPDEVITDINSGLVTLVWNNNAMGINQLVGENPTGKVSQGANITGTIRSVEVLGTQSSLVLVPTNGSDPFNTTDAVTVNAILTNLAPNPISSDNICVAVFWYYQQYVTGRQFTTSPDLWVSVAVADADTDIGPANAAVDLIKPNAVTVLPDSSVNLTYSIEANNLGLLPTTFFKSSTVAQATSGATGIYNGYTISGNNVIINVTGVDGTFDTTNTIDITLDISANGFAYIDDKEIASFLIAADIPNFAHLETTYPAFVNGVVAQQTPEAASRRKYNVQGYFGYAFQKPNDVVLTSMVAPDTEKWVATVRLDVPSIYQYPAVGFVQAAQHMFMDLNNEDPYYDDSGTGIIINQAASSNQSTMPTIAQANQLTEQGWTVLLPNNAGQLYPFRNVNCLQTVAGRQDVEYRFQALQLKLRWIDKNCVEVGDASCIRPDGSRDNDNPELLLRLNTNLTNVLTVANNAGMIGDNYSVDISLSTTDVTRFNVIITVSIVSANSGLDFVVIVRPYSL